MRTRRECNCSQCRGDGPPDSWWGFSKVDDYETDPGADDADDEQDDRTEEREEDE
jgi:hypothetical protein